MTEFTIKSLTIQDFKGIRDLTVPFGEGVTSIYGDNATGKTTVYDALLWLLFGKDSAGRSQFEVKPVHNPGAMPTVTGAFEINGSPLRLRKIMREVWTARRGSSTKEFSGHTVEYSINEVPVKEGEYRERICALVDEQRFQMLTRVGMFAGSMRWQDRRKILFDLAGLPDDEDVLACEERFAALAGALEGRTVEDYRKVVEKERKGLRTDLDAIPYRLDELAKSMARIVVPDVEQVKARGAEIDAQLADLDRQAAQLDNGTALAGLQSKRDILRAESAQLEAENREYRAGQQKPAEPDRRLELRAIVRCAQQDVDRCSRRLAGEQDDLDFIEKSMAALRERFQAVAAEQFEGADICPTCGQPLPAEKVAVAREGFRQEQEARLDKINAEGAKLAARKKSAEERLAAEQKRLDDAKAELEKAEAELAAYVPPAPVEIRDMDDYQDRRRALGEDLAYVDKRMAEVRGEQSALRAEINDERKRLNDERAAGLLSLGAQAALEDGKRREEELRREQRALGDKLEQLDKMIALCEDFAVYKCGLIEQSVNAPFRLADFQLFKKQINGAVVDCCEVVVGGVPYADLNNAMRINVGLDIIDVLSRWYELRVPLVVDNAEGVTDLLDIGGQVVRLVVSEQDKELRIV